MKGRTRESRGTVEHGVDEWRRVGPGEDVDTVNAPLAPPDVWGRGPDGVPTTPLGPPRPRHDGVSLPTVADVPSLAEGNTTGPTVKSPRRPLVPLPVPLTMTMEGHRCQGKPGDPSPQ